MPDETGCANNICSFIPEGSSWKQAMYYNTASISKCYCAIVSSFNTYYRIDAGPTQYDSTSVFQETPPLDCDFGSDGNWLCLKSGSPNQIYQSSGSTNEFTLIAPGLEEINHPTVQVSTGNNNWNVALTTSGWHSLRNAMGAVATAVIGQDGVVAYIPLQAGGGAAPPGACQLTDTVGGYADCVWPLGGAGASCMSIEVLDAKNIMCFNGNQQFYWLNHGYPSGAWVQVAVPAPFGHDCDLTATPASCLVRPDVGDLNPSRGDGYAYFSYRDSSQVPRGAKFLKQT